MSLPFEPRIEDHWLLTGTGRFLDDERVAAAAHGVFVRSPHGFAGIRGIDASEARHQPGVLAVLTAADMQRAGIGNVAVVAPIPNGAGLVVPLRPALAGDCVRHVGDAVALVVADNEAAARDAAELVAVDYEPRDPVTDVARAVAPDAPSSWRRWSRAARLPNTIARPTVSCCIAPRRAPLHCARMSPRRSASRRIGCAS